MKKWTLDLSLKPILRWQQICAYPLYQQLAQYLVNTVDALLPGGGQVFEEIGMEINQLIRLEKNERKEKWKKERNEACFWYCYVFWKKRSDYAQEIHGCAGSLGISTGWLTIMNLGYEVCILKCFYLRFQFVLTMTLFQFYLKVSDACTSIVAEGTDGTIFHARNLGKK